MNKPLVTLLTLQNFPATSDLPSSMWPDFPLMLRTTQRFTTSMLSKLNLMLKSLVVVKAALTGNAHHQLAGCLYEWFCSHNPLHMISGHNTHNDFG